MVSPTWEKNLKGFSIQTRMTPICQNSRSPSVVDMQPIAAIEGSKVWAATYRTVLSRFELTIMSLISNQFNRRKQGVDRLPCTHRPVNQLQVLDIRWNGATIQDCACWSGFPISGKGASFFMSQEVADRDNWHSLDRLLDILPAIALSRHIFLS